MGARRVLQQGARFGGHGLVTFLGGTNDDFFTGMVSIARLFIVSGQGGATVERERDRCGCRVAKAARRADVGDRESRKLHPIAGRAISLSPTISWPPICTADETRTELRCWRHDGSRWKRPRTFVDLFEVFGPEAGVSWFNDYVHPSLLGHERIARAHLPPSALRPTL